MAEAVKPSISARLKGLLKSHGRYALGVYLAIGTVDLAATYLTLSYVPIPKSILPTPPTEEKPSSTLRLLAEKSGLDAQKVATFVLAYGIHKTALLPFRVGITAAVTPGVKRWIVRRGWAS